MSNISINTPAPDFELADTAGKPIRLSDFRGRIVLLVFNAVLSDHSAARTWRSCARTLQSLRNETP
jgi:peroxiredoxin